MCPRARLSRHWRRPTGCGPRWRCRRVGTGFAPTRSTTSATGWSPITPENFCAACRHNRTIPDLSNPDNLAHWRKIEFAKHRLFYSLLRLDLPLATKTEDPNGLAFDFLSSLANAAAGNAPVLTGHASGLITLNLAEADDPERERQRKSMGSLTARCSALPREVAHYCWDVLVKDTEAIEEFPAAVRRRARGLRAGAAAALCQRPAAGLAGTLRHHLCELAPVGRLRRNVGALFPHGRHARNRVRLRFCGCGQRSAPSLPRRSTSTPTLPRWIGSSTPGCR